MKKLSYLLVAMTFVFSSAFLTSCFDEASESTLRMNVQETGSPSYEPGSSVPYEITVTSNKDIEGVTVNADDGETSYTFTDDELEAGTVDSVTTLNYDYSIPESLADGEEVTLTFTATDEDKSVNSSASLTVVDKTGLTTEEDGVIYHILGPDQGAWDLVANTGVSEGGTSNRYLGSDKDMINRESVDGDAEFLNEFVAGNETRYVKANDFDYENATVEDAKATYEAASEVLGAAEEAGYDWNDFKYATANEGDVFVAKLRGNDEYAAIHITEVVNDANNDGDTDDDSHIKFSYKKAPSDAAKAAGKGVMVFY